MNYKNYSKYKNEDISIESLFVGGSSLGVDITKNNVLKNSDIVLACVNYISSTVAKLPLGLYENTNTGKTKVDNEVTAVLKRPNSYVTYTDFIQTMICNMLIWGNAFALIVTKGSKVSELKVLEPSSTRLEKIKDKWFVITTIDNKQQTLDYKQVIHVRDLSTDGINGISRLDAIKSKVENRASADSKLSRYMKNGNGGVKGIIVADVEGDLAKLKLKEGFNKVLKSNDDDIAVINTGMDYKKIDGANLADLEFVNNMKLTKRDIAMCFGVNPCLIGSSEEATNSNLQTLKLDFIQSLIPLINKIEDEFTYKLLNFKDREKKYFKFNMSAAMRATDLERADFYVKMFRNGFMNADEIRALEERDNLSNGLGDLFYRDLNLVEMTYAQQYQLGKAGVENPTE